MKINLAFSTCPNDTFMFDALVNKRIDLLDMEFTVDLADIHQLNQLAFEGKMDMIKISYNTFAQIQNEYDLLDSGSALGFGCGPLLIAKPGTDLSSLKANNARIAIPGKNTTANLLLSFFAPELQNRVEMLFHEIMPAVISGQVDAGLIIHENRFTYAQHGLVQLADLGTFWEDKTGLPIPLGAIVVRKNLPETIRRKLATLMQKSVEFAFEFPEVSMPFVRKHAQEMEEEIMQAHIKLYVNEYSISLGKKGLDAICTLLKEGEKAGHFKAGTATAFAGPVYPQKTINA